MWLVCYSWLFVSVFFCCCIFYYIFTESPVHPGCVTFDSFVFNFIKFYFKFLLFVFLFCFLTVLLGFMILTRMHRVSPSPQRLPRNVSAFTDRGSSLQYSPSPLRHMLTKIEEIT